jgi:hypothetical protein
MPEQELNRADVRAGFEEMDREGVAERMRRDRFRDRAPLARLLAGLLDRIVRHVRAADVAG